MYQRLTWNEMIPETIKLLDENIGSNHFDITFSNIFLDVSLWARKSKKKKLTNGTI